MTNNTLSIEEKLKIYNSLEEVKSRIPLDHHYSKRVVLTKNSDLVGGYKLSPLAVDHLSPSDIESALQFLKQVVIQNFNEKYIIHTHIIRRRIELDNKLITEKEQEENLELVSFDESFYADYVNSLNNKGVYENSFYITIYQKTDGAGKAVGRLFEFFQKFGFGKKDKEKSNLVNLLLTELQTFEDKLLKLDNDLSAYAVIPLKTKEIENQLYSEIGSLYSQLVSFYRNNVPVSAEPLANVITNSHILWANRLGEIRGINNSKFFEIASIQDFKDTTRYSDFDKLLTAPIEFNLTHTFSPMNKEVAIKYAKKKETVLANVETEAISDLNEITNVNDDIRSNRLTLGKSNTILTVFSDSIDELDVDFKIALSDFEDAGYGIERAGLNIGAQFFSQLNGNSYLNSRSKVITSENFVGISPLFGQSTAYKAKGNHWGDAVLPFRSRYLTPQHFSFHVDQVGSTTILGMTGAGKTVLFGALLTASQRFDTFNILFDVDKSSIQTVKALNGHYIEMNLGESTGFNPFQLEGTESHKFFLKNLIINILISRDVTPKEEKDIASAIDHVYTLDSTSRRIGNIIGYLSSTGDDSVAVYLEKWVENGEYAWIFDNKEDTFSMTNNLTAVDVTQFLDENTPPEIKGSITSYLLYRSRLMIKDRRVIVWFDEFWQMINDERIGAFVVNELKTIRKKDGLIVTATQSPNDAIRSPLGRDIIEGCPTKIFLANSEAQEEDYIGQLGFNDAQFQMLTQIHKSSRMFLVKQENTVSFFEFNLNEELEKYARVFSKDDITYKIFQRWENEGFPDDWINQLSVEYKKEKELT